MDKKATAAALIATLRYLNEQLTPDELLAFTDSDNRPRLLDAAKGLARKPQEVVESPIEWSFRFDPRPTPFPRITDLV